MNGNKGKIRTPEMKERYRLCKLGAKNPRYGKFDHLSPVYKASTNYRALHCWVQSRLGKPNKCTKCSLEDTNTRRFHWANISHKYKRDLNDWVRLCVKCHAAFDKKFRQSQNH